MVVFPDIHGRIFWKDMVRKYPSETFLFLGDYLDPYPAEKITVEDAIANFEDILLFKKQHPDKVILLIGNHDLGYIWKNICSCRRIQKYYNDISAMFKDNFELFDLAYQVQIGDISYLFTHAGVHKRWFENLLTKIGESTTCNKIDIANILNTWFHNKAYTDFDKENLLGMVSYLRAGIFGGEYGSCVWADVREWGNIALNTENKQWENLYQIFGHTQLEYNPIITEVFACIDTRRGYIFTDEHTLVDINNKDGSLTYKLNK
jgi:hypothetical protein